MFENPRRGRQARNLTTNVPKILDLKSSSEQTFFRKLSLGAPAESDVKLSSKTLFVFREKLRFLMTATGMMVWWKSFNSIQVLAIYFVLRLSLGPSERVTCFATSWNEILRVLPPTLKPVLQQIRFLLVAWILTSDWLKLRGSQAIDGRFFTFCQAHLPWAGKMRKMYRFFLQ